MISSIAMTTSSPLTMPPMASDIFESSDELILSPRLSPESKSPTTSKSAHARQWVNTISNRLASSLNLSSSWTSSSNSNGNSFKWPLQSPTNRTLSGQSNELIKISPDDIASQLTLIDLPIFQKITKEELTSIAWNTSKKHTLAPNIVKFTKRFNQVSFWVVEQVLQSSSQLLNAGSSVPGNFHPLSSNLFSSIQEKNGTEKSNRSNRNFIRRLSRNSSHTSLSYQSTLELDAKARSELVSYFIKIAKRLFDLNNLHSSFAIICALSSTPIYRLSKTWSYLGKKDKIVFDKLSAFYSDESNFEALRRHLDESPLPCIPYLGMYLRDLVYIDIANPKKVVKIQTDAMNVPKARVTRQFASTFEQQVSTQAYEKINAKSKPVEVNGQCLNGKVTSNASNDHQIPIVTNTRNSRFQSIISQIQYFQQSTYSDLSVIPEIRDHLLSARYIEELQKFLEEDNYKLSLKLEPNVSNCNVSNQSINVSIKQTQTKNQSKFYISRDDEPIRLSENGLKVPIQFQPSNSMPGAYDRPTSFKPGHRRAHSLDTGPLLLSPIIDGTEIEVDRRVSVDPSTFLESGPIMRPELDDVNSDWMMVDNIKKSLIDDSIIGETSFRPFESQNPVLASSFGKGNQNRPELRTRKSSFDGFLNSAFVRSPNSQCSKSQFHVDTNVASSSFPKRIEPLFPMSNGNQGNGTQWPNDCHCTKSCTCTSRCDCIKRGVCECSGNCSSGGDCKNGSGSSSLDSVQFRSRSSAMSKDVPTFSGVMKRRILVKDGRKCSCSVWIPYYVDLKGCLMIYYPKLSLSACSILDKSHFNMDQCKKLSLIGGWTVEKNVSTNEVSEFSVSPKYQFTLSDPSGKNVYEFMVDDGNEYEIWVTKLKSLSNQPSGLYRGPAKNLRTPALSQYSVVNKQNFRL